MWQVRFTVKASKQTHKLPEIVLLILQVLVEEMRREGPFRSTWKNYSKLGPHLYHCHLKKGRPTYVVCWEIKDKNNHIVEIYYVGTHEKAPY